jgi:hypothetical protein
MGKMSIRLLPADMIFILKDTVAIEVTYYSTVFVIKLSILYLYLRFGKLYSLLWKIISNPSSSYPDMVSRRLLLHDLPTHYLHNYVYHRASCSMPPAP